jgi:histidinol-phosphate aminotransferase
LHFLSTNAVFTDETWSLGAAFRSERRSNACLIISKNAPEYGTGDGFHGARNSGRHMRSRGLTQGVAHAALAGPEELARAIGLAEVVRLGSNESPFGPSPDALDAMRRESANAHRYGDPSAALLREEIARRHGVAPANVAVGAGIDDLLGSIVRAYLTPGATAIAGLGTFPTFEMHVTGFEGRLERVPYLRDGRLDLEGFLCAARRNRGGIIFFPNPDNPSGSVYSWRDVSAFLDALPDGALVIHDEAYANFLPADERFPADALDERMFRLRTFSKEHGLAGLRVGYALASVSAIAAIDALRLLYGVSRIAQAAALASLADERHVGEVVRRIRAGRADYHALGERLDIRTLPSETNFVLFEFESAERASAVVEALLRSGIHVRKPPAPPLDRYVRVTVGSEAERGYFARALEEIVAGP